MTQTKKTNSTDNRVFTYEKDFFGTQEDRPEDRTPTSRACIRSELTNQVEAFLASGGKISEVEPGKVSDPPRKPTSNYGSRPI